MGLNPQCPRYEEVLGHIELDQWKPPDIPNVTSPMQSLPPNQDAPTEASGAIRLPAPAEHLDRVKIPVKAHFRPKQFLISHGQPPKNDDGVNMCLSYHVLGEWSRVRILV